MVVLIVFILGMVIGVAALLIIAKALAYFERNEWDDGPAFEKKVRMEK